MSNRSAARPVVRTTGQKDWVNFAKGAAIFLVVLYHSALFLHSLNFPITGIGRVKTVLELVPMPVFLFVAGLYHFRVLDWTLAQTWKRRLFGYLYLYVLWSVIRFAFYFVVPNVRSDGAGVEASNPLALLGILVWPISSYWFILALLVFTVLLWAAKFVPRPVALAIATGISVIFSAGFLTTLNVGWDRMGEYLLFFLIGAFFSKRLFAFISGASGLTVAASGVVYAVCAVTAAVVRGAAHVPGLVLIGELAAILFVATVSVRLVRLRMLRWVSYAGERSLQIYLVHVFVIAALSVLLSYLPVLGTLPGRGIPLLLGLTVVVTLLSLLLGRLLGNVTWLFVPPRWMTRKRPSSGQRRTSIAVASSSAEK